VKSPLTITEMRTEELATRLSIWDSIATSNFNLLAGAFNSLDAAQSRWTQISSANGRQQLNSDLSQAIAAYRRAFHEVETLQSEYPQYEDVRSALTQPNIIAFLNAADNFSNAVGNVPEHDPPKDLEVRMRPLAGALKREMNVTQRWLSSLQQTANEKRTGLTNAK
jgi:hypothetical protein